MKTFWQTWKSCNSNSDRWGIIISFLCCIHCLLTPMLLVAAPLTVNYFSHQIFHLVVLIVVLPLALWAFIRHFRTHKEFMPGLLGAMGIVTLAVVIIMEQVWQIHIPYENLITFTGGLCLIVGHWLNIKKTLHLSGCHHHCHDPHHQEQPY